LTRFNELTASLAAGVPLLRTAAPIILAALGLNALLIIDQEVIIPHIIPELTRKHDEVQPTADQKSNKSFSIKAMQDDRNALLVAGRYHPPTPKFPARMEQVDIIQLNVQQQPESHTRADVAVWDADRNLWRLENGVRVAGLLPNYRRSPEEKIDVFVTSITPDEINLYRSGDFVELLSTSHINQLLDRPKSYGTNNLLRVKHARITQFLLNVVLLLLALPCVMSREPGKLKLGAVKCVVLCGTCLATIFISHQLAGTPPAGAEWVDRWPLLMAWIPIFIFVPVSVLLLDRMHRIAS
jgi:lipopolysaccharide export LptBFGC system permease protein LptF